MTYGSIVAYMYAADYYCDECIVEVLIGSGLASPAARDMALSDVLHQVAEANGIDPTDERTFDSDEFPKRVLCEELQGGEHCGRCLEPIE